MPQFSVRLTHIGMRTLSFSGVGSLSAKVGTSEDEQQSDRSALSGGKVTQTVYGGSPPAADADAKAGFQLWASLPLRMNGNVAVH